MGEQKLGLRHAPGDDAPRTMQASCTLVWWQSCAGHACWEVWPGDVRHQLRQADVRVVDERLEPRDDLHQVMGRDVGRHAHCYSLRVHQDQFSGFLDSFGPQAWALWTQIVLLEYEAADTSGWTSCWAG